MGRGAGGRANATNLDNTELAAVDNISVFILPSEVNNVGQIGSRDRLGLHRPKINWIMRKKEFC